MKPFSPLDVLQPPNQKSKLARKLAKTVEEIMARTDHPDETYCILMARSIGLGASQAELVDAIGSLIYALANVRAEVAKELPMQVAAELRRYGIEPGDPSGRIRIKPGFASRIAGFFRRIFKGGKA